MIKHICIYTLFITTTAFAQQENKYIRDGNREYEQKNYAQAEQQYKQALEKNPQKEAAAYNLGNALYSQQKLEESMQQYEAIARSSTDPGIRSKAWHNLGNAYLDQKDYNKSIEAYKQALKASPSDQDTKYNLAYAQARLKQQQEQQKKDQQQQDEKKEDEKKEEKPQNPDENKKDDQKKDQQQQPQDKQFSPEELERIMQQLNKEDKDVQNKVNQQKTSGTAAKSDKDW
jgi:tetratricopeptide (TPR) repeat protein